MAILVQVQLRCAKEDCTQSILTWHELEQETDGDGFPTGLLTMSTNKLTLPSGWHLGRYFFGPYCPVHKEPW